MHMALGAATIEAMTSIPGAQSLSRGLRVLTTLVHADGPLTATEIAHRCHCHQTTASRILAALIEAGYVRKVSYREFAPDFGLLALGIEATGHFDLISLPRPALDRCAEICAPMMVSLCLMWRGQLLYFDQSTRGFDTRVFQGKDYPIHLSSPGLLFMTEMSRTEALQMLRASRHKFGWPRTTASVPETETATLNHALRLVRNDTLVLKEWAEPGHITAAARLPDHHGHPLALAIAGPADIFSVETLRMRLLACRSLVLPALPAPNG